MDKSEDQWEGRKNMVREKGRTVGEITGETVKAKGHLRDCMGI